MTELAQWCPDFDTGGDPQLIAMLSKARRFVMDYKAGASGRWLSLLGTSGAGKTFLADIVREKTKQAWRVGSGEDSFIQYTRWPKHHWPTIGERMLGGEWDLWEMIAEQDECVIDDIGADNDPKKTITDKLCKIAEMRLGKWTVFTSNLTLGDIARQLDQRISSRMNGRNGNECVSVDVIDYNLRRRAA